MSDELEVGRVAALWRYPVKSMAGEALERVHVSYNGLAGDRRWAFVRPGLERSNFPWLTIRQQADLWHHRPRLTEPDRPDESATVVQTPSGARFDVCDPALAQLLGDGVRVIKQNRGVFDWLALSLITTRSVAELGALVGRELDVRRFRPNIVVEPSADGPFPEDEWVGRTLRIGELTMRVDERDERCVMTNVDPDTTERDPTILRTIAQQRQACLGVYGSTALPGTIAVGDAVVVTG